MTSVVYADGLLAKGSTVATESVAVDSAGDSFITGSFTGTVTLGTSVLTSRGAQDMYVAKLDPTGSVIWAKRMGSSVTTDGDYGRSVGVDTSGYVYATGFFAGAGDVDGKINVPASSGGRSIVVVKFDWNGNVQWVKAFSGTGPDMGQHLTFDTSGNLYLTGSYSGTTKFDSVALTSQGSSDAFVVRMSSSTGAVAWAKSMGGPGNDASFSISVDPAGNIFTTGIFYQTATFGSYSLTSNGDSDIFVAKMDSNGNVLWARGYGALGHDDGTSLVNDGSGGVYITGDMVGNVAFGPYMLVNATAYSATKTTYDDIYVAHLDSSGNVTWAHNFGGPGFDAGFSITRDAAGYVYNTGIFQGTASFPWGGTVLVSKGDYDVYLAKLDPSGNVVSAQSFGSTVGDQGFDVAVGGPSNNIFLAGNYGGPVNLPYYGLPNAPTGGGYVVELSQGNLTGTTKVVSDFDATGHSEIAYYIPSNEQWWVRGPSGKDRLMATFGLVSAGIASAPEVPITGDFLGLGRPQVGVYNESNGAWYVLNPNTLNAQYIGTFGDPTQHDIPVPGVYTNDSGGKTQLAVYRPGTGDWFLLIPGGYKYLGRFGDPTQKDLPVPGNYDSTGFTELAYYRPLTGKWYVNGPKGAYYMGQFGAPNLLTGYGDVPIPGDYDAIGRTQPAVFRPTTAVYYVYRSSGNTYLGTDGTGFFYEIPTQAAAGWLLYPAGRITGGVTSLAARAIAVPSGPSTTGTGPQTSVAAKSVVKTSSHASKTTVNTLASLGVRSSVVTGQGASSSTSKTDPISSALEALYRG